jgi:hypothetical protein
MWTHFATKSRLLVKPTNNYATYATSNSMTQNCQGWWIYIEVGVQEHKTAQGWVFITRRVRHTGASHLTKGLRRAVEQRLLRHQLSDTTMKKQDKVGVCVCVCVCVCCVCVDVSSVPPAVPATRMNGHLP